MFWNRQHYMGTVVYRPVFMRDMAARGPYFSELLLNALLFAGSKYTMYLTTDSKRHNPDPAGRQFRRRFEEILYGSRAETLLRSKITTVQALLIVADCLFSWCDESSLSWHYIGIAINMIVDLGIHADSPACPAGAVTPEDVEVRRRVFWAAYGKTFPPSSICNRSADFSLALDKVQSIYQGRPARLREGDNRVPIRFLDDYEELEPFSTHSYADRTTLLACPSYSVSSFEQLCKLSIIMERILYNLYGEKTSTRSIKDLRTISDDLHRDLNDFKVSMPTHLVVQLNEPGASNVLPHALSLL